MAVLFQVLSTLVVCYICMSLGIMFAWPSSTLKLFSSVNTTLSRPMTEAEVALFGSLSSIGGLISTPVAGIVLDLIGRKYCLIAASLTHVIAWTLISTFKQAEVILVAVFIAGIGGAVGLVVPVFVAEICQDNIRGTMTSGSMIFYAVGMLVSYLLGGCLEYKPMVYVCLTLAVLGSVMVCFLRESAMFLYKKGLLEEAAKSIAFYRSLKPNSKEVQEEMEKLRRAFNPELDDEEKNPEEEKLNPEEKSKQEEKPAEKLSLWKFFKKSRATRQAVYLTLILCTAAIFQGLVVVQVYAEPLFEEAVPNLSPTVCSVLLAIISVIAGFAAAYLTDLAGRRPLIIYASVAAGLCCVILATQLQFLWAPHWVTAVIIYLFTVTYTCGAGTVPFVLIAEVFSPEVKSFMSMFVMEWAWLCNFVILFIFNPLVSAIGLGPVFYIFAAVCFMTSVYSIFYLPETKGLPIDAIQALFSKKRRH